MRIDPGNLNILRDLSLLQIQMRDLTGFAVTRHTLLELKPNVKFNWLAFGLSKHLTGDFRGAVAVIDAYLGTVTIGSPELERGFESSELALYRNMILSEIPDNYQEALDDLTKCEGVVVDRTAWLMTRAKYELLLARFEAAKATFILLFDRGMTEDYRVHSGYMAALLELDGEGCISALLARGMETVATIRKLDPAQKQMLLDDYRGNLSAKYPRSPAVQRIQLTLLEGEEMRSALDAYCRKLLAKGMPSLCPDVAALVTSERDGKLGAVVDPADMRSHSVYRLLVDLADGYVASLTSDSKFSPDDDKEEPPSTILWALYLRAGLHELAGEYSEGIALLDKCIEHTPTAVDVYELKARLLKAAGDMPSAVECVDTGRELDKQDRYINNQTTKYMLQAGMEETALERIAMFTKHEGNPEQNLFDMQCSWYELELAECLAKKENWGRSLKKFGEYCMRICRPLSLSIVQCVSNTTIISQSLCSHLLGAVVKHFDDFQEDQFDFHQYCVRKVTLRAYMETLRFEDNLWGQDYYQRAAQGIITIYLYLYDNPNALSGTGDDEPDYSNMTAAEKKKAKAIARKKKKKAADKPTETADEENGDKKSKNAQKPVVEDPDPDGKELLKKDPLEEAKNYSAILSKHAPKNITTWILQYDVSIRRSKTLLALQALFKARALDPESGDLITRIVDFALKIDTSLKTNVAAVQLVVSKELPKLLDGKSVDDFVKAARDKVLNDPLTTLPTRVAVAKALVSTKTSSVADAASLIVNGGLQGRGVFVESCRAALTALRGLGSEADDATSQWISDVKQRFPLLVDF